MAKRYYTASFHNGGRKEDSKDTKGNGKSVKFQANREHNIRDEEYCKNQEHIGFKNKTEKEHEVWAKTHVLIDEKPEDAYERIFGEAVKKYDEKQKRSDRKIGSGKNYYEKIKKSKNKVPVYEFIITLGNKDNRPDNTEEVRQIYIEALNNFKTRNPNFEVIGAYYHDDESRDDGKGGKVQGAPHLHVDYIPVSRNRWQNFIDEQNKKETLIDKIKGNQIQKKCRVNGLDVENSLTEALASQGFISKEIDVSVIEKKFGIHITDKHYKDPKRQAQYEEFMSNRTDEKGKQIKTRLLTAQMQWIKNERDCLIRCFEKHGYKIKNPEEHRPHLETQDFIESKDMNIQEKNIELYNALSSKIDFIEVEEKELSEKKKAVAEEKEKLTAKETSLKAKEEAQNKREKEQNARDAILESKFRIVKEAEEQLAEAKNINEENKAIFEQIDAKEKNIGLIEEELYPKVRAEVDKEYKEKYQELYDAQKAMKGKETELNAQKAQQDENERKQTEKATELYQRELNVADLEAYKKNVNEKEKAVSQREAAVDIEEEANKNKENDLKNKEYTLNQKQKDLEARENAVKTATKDMNEKNIQLNEREQKLDSKEQILNHIDEVQKERKDWIKHEEKSINEKAEVFNKIINETNKNLHEIDKAFKAHEHIPFNFTLQKVKDIVDKTVKGLTAFIVNIREKLEKNEKRLENWRQNTDADTFIEFGKKMKSLGFENYEQLEKFEKQQKQQKRQYQGISWD